MWVWASKRGALIAESCKAEFGYSGHGDGYNNPAMQHVRNVGPIPVGFYTIQSPADDDELGPHVLRLVPHSQNTMFGRSKFAIHGDKNGPPRQASEGCIILPRHVREMISGSHDTLLRVIDI